MTSGSPGSPYWRRSATRSSAAWPEPARMSEGHRHPPAGSQRRQGRLAIVLVLAAGHMLAEAVGGLWTGSLALLADAGHMLTDVIALSFGLFAVRIAQRSPTPQRTYGYHRSEILVALGQGAQLVGVAPVSYTHLT